MESLLEEGVPADNISAVIIREENKSFITGKDADITVAVRLAENGHTEVLYAGEMDPSDTNDNPTAVARILEFAQEVDPDNFAMSNHTDLMDATTRGNPESLENGALRSYAGVSDYRWINASLRGENTPYAAWEKEFLASGYDSPDWANDPDGTPSFERIDRALMVFEDRASEYGKLPARGVLGNQTTFAEARLEWNGEAYVAKQEGDTKRYEAAKAAISP